MADLSAIRTVARQLSKAKVYSDVFGKLTGDIDAKRAGLRRQFALLATILHPDHAEKDAQNEATTAFDLLNKLRSAADDAIRRDTYERPFGDSVPEPAVYGPTLVSRNGSYRLEQDSWKDGDFSIIYRGKAAASGIIAKIAIEPSSNAWLEKEARLLAEFRTGDARGIARYAPELLDTFFVKGETNRQYRVNIQKEIPDLIPIADIIEAFPEGLAPPQAAWIGRRVIAQSIAARMIGVVHAAITPDHVLVDPYKHEPLHIGWAHAIQDPKTSKRRVTHIIDRWRDLYPPEILEKKLPDHRADIYMAGATIFRLLGGDVSKRTLPDAVPESMAQVLLRSIEHTPNRRYQDGSVFLDEFTRVVRSIWGRTYRPLIMPVR